ncbi:MAG TPA: GGDEF domain-containing protein, partial [Verrucomicrobiae bacterium]|nr:GGDEF domain-containing protein [Verrucomicrobiae bacterium]
FNDTYGHDVGDQALKLVARKIQGVGGGGLAYRYGGEEFALLFPRRSIAEAGAQLEALRTAIADYPLRLRGEGRPADEAAGRSRRRAAGDDSHNVRVTVSIGVAESGGGATPGQVLKAADQALYRAKKKGRNQVSR